LCFFRALQLGPVNKVSPLKKSSTILTMILAFIFLGEPLGILTAVGMAVMAAGTFLMVEGKKPAKENERSKNNAWFFFGIIAAVFASITAIFATLGFQEIDASLGTAIRTMAVLPIAWLMVFVTGAHKKSGKFGAKNWIFLILSGFATGISWLLFFRALHLGPASNVVLVDILSIVFTMLFARIFLGERFSKRNLAGLALLTAGTVVIIL
jgi:transporter family protein